MNRTNFEHLILALVLQGVLYLLTGNWWIGAAFSSGIFLGREHAQREYHIGDPSQLVGYEALDFYRWSLDAQLDLAFPFAAVVLVAAAFG